MPHVLLCNSSPGLLKNGKMNLCMSMGSRENKQNKVRTQLWDTLYYYINFAKVRLNLYTPHCAHWCDVPALSHTVHIAGLILPFSPSQVCRRWVHPNRWPFKLKITLTSSPALNVFWGNGLDNLTARSKASLCPMLRSRELLDIVDSN